MKVRIFPLFLTILLLFAVLPCNAYAAEDPRFDGKTLEEIVDDFMEEHHVTYVDLAFGYYNTVTGESYYYNGDELLNAASLYKVPLNMYYAELIGKGEFSFDTEIDGHTYEDILYRSIELSNNDLSEALQAEIGTYEEYRTALLPLLGETAESVDPKYFSHNTFTAKQLIHCLKLLYEEPERFPRVLEHMINQDHFRIFMLKETRYQMANKYGFLFYESNDIQYEVDNEVAIVYTEDPFLMVAMGCNVSGTAGTLSRLCTLFCDYTNYCRELRLEREAEERSAAELLAIERETAAWEHSAADQAEAEIAAEAQAAEPAPQEQPAAPDQMPSTEAAPGKRRMPLWPFLLLLPAAAVPVFLCLKKKRRPETDPSSDEAAPMHSSAQENITPDDKEHRPMKTGVKLFAAFLTILTLAAVVGTIFLCRYASNATPQIIGSTAKPEDTVNAYFTDLCAGSFTEADSYLSSAVTTLNTEPNSEVGALLFDALWDNFSYACSEPAVVNGLTATQKVTVTYLDIPALTALQRTHMRSALEQLAEEAEDPDALLDDEGFYNTEVSMIALRDVTARLLEDPGRFLISQELTVNLEYINHRWMIIPDGTLYAVLSGNTY